jgi:hypothetical protein
MREVRRPGLSEPISINNELVSRGGSGRRIASSQASNTPAEEDQMATKKQKRQAAATGTGATTKPKPKKKTSRGK